MTDTTATKTCPGCQAEVAVEALRCLDCMEWLLSSVPTKPPVQAPALAPAPAPSKPQWLKVITMVLGVIVAGFMAIVILSVLAVGFLGEKSEAKFKSVGSEIGAPASRGVPTTRLPLV